MKCYLLQQRYSRLLLLLTKTSRQRKNDAANTKINALAYSSRISCCHGIVYRYRKSRIPRERKFAVSVPYASFSLGQECLHTPKFSLIHSLLQYLLQAYICFDHKARTAAEKLKDQGFMTVLTITHIELILLLSFQFY